MALFHECTQSCAHIGLDTADIVRDEMFQQLEHFRLRDQVLYFRSRREVKSGIPF